MKIYRATQPDAPVPQLLQIYWEGEMYAFRLQHVSHEDMLHLCQQGHEAAPKRTHRHNFYHLVLYTQGEGFFQTEDQLRPFRAGTLAITSPDIRHQFHNCCDSAFLYKEITFSLETTSGKALTLPFQQVMELLIGEHLPKLAIAHDLTVEQASTVERAIDQVLLAFQNPDTWLWFEVHNRILQVFRSVLGILAADRPIDSPLDPRLEKTRLAIELDIQRNWTVDELAMQANLSPGHFQRAFRQTYSKSPIAYQQSLRLELASYLLKATTLTVSQITERCGYQSLAYFSRLFTQKNGQSPSQFRNRLDDD